MQRYKPGEGANREHIWQVSVRSTAHLDKWIEDYFEGLHIKHHEDGTSVLTGELPDMPAVYGLLLGLRDAGIFLLSLQAQRVSRSTE